MVDEITSKKTFDNILLDKKNKIVVVDFFAQWCGPCKLLSPQFTTLAEKYKKQPVKFIKVDIDSSPEIIEVCDITAVPTIFFYKDAKCVDALQGPTIQAINEIIQKIMKN